MTRIKEIKFNKKENLDANDKNDKNITKYITTNENVEIKSELNDLSRDSNRFELKNIDNDLIVKNREILLLRLLCWTWVGYGVL